MKLDEIKKTLDKILELAQLNLQKDGHLMPAAFVMAGNGQFQVVAVTMENKEQTASMIRDYCHKVDATFVALLSDTYVKVFKEPPKENEEMKPASKYPDKKEAITISYESPTECGSIMTIYTKDNDKYTFEPPLYNVSDKIEGTLTGFLPRYN